MADLRRFPAASEIRSSFRGSFLKCSRTATDSIPKWKYLSLASNGESINDYPYDLIPLGYNNSSRRINTIPGQESDRHDYGSDPYSANSDGTWNTGHDFPFAPWGNSAWMNGIAYDGGTTSQDKAKIYGPAKGTLIVTTDLPAGGGVYGSGLGGGGLPEIDPWANGNADGTITCYGGVYVTVVSATYYNLGPGQWVELKTDHLGSNVLALVVFRWGKQPSDFAWYPL